MLTGMPTPAITAAMLVLVAAIEAGTWVRVPLGLVLAIALLAQHLGLAPVVVLGAVGVAAGRVLLAVRARRRHAARGAGALVTGSTAGAARITEHPAFARISFTMSMLPGMPGRFLFPLLGRLRAPLGPAIAGTLVGRLPILALTTTCFVALGRLSTSGDDSSAALMLGILAVGLVVVGALRLVDWEHRAAGGGWRMRGESPDAGARVTSMFGGADDSGARGSGPKHPAGPGNGTASTLHDPAEHGDVIEGKIVGHDEDG